MIAEKPRVATVLTFGWGYNKQEIYPALVGQLRGVINPKTGQPVSNAGMRSLWGEHAKEGETLREAAVRCAVQEFWARAFELRRNDFTPIGQQVETEKSINQLFLLGVRLRWRDIVVREGDGVFFAPLGQVPDYIRHGFLTEASVSVLKAAPPLEELWELIPKEGGFS